MERRQCITQSSFHVRLRLFYRVKIRRIRRQEQKPDTRIFGKLAEFRFPMESCVVHDYGVSFGYRFDKAFAEPALKELGIGRVAVTLYSKVLPVAQSAYDVHALELTSVLFAVYFPSPQRTSVFAHKAGIYPTFITYTRFSLGISAIVAKYSVLFSSDLSEYKKVFFSCYLHLLKHIKNRVRGAPKRLCQIAQKCIRVIFYSLPKLLPVYLP